MLGKIKYVNPITEGKGKFKGVIIGEDNVAYHFNDSNWCNTALEAADIAEEAAVEFDLRPPNSQGRIFPKLIRFAGENISPSHVNAFTTKHKYGDFRKLLFARLEDLTVAFSHLIPGFSDTIPGASNGLFKKLATAYNELSDEAFCFYEHNGVPSLKFPSGFQTADQQPIYLYCVKNPEPEKSTWICDRLLCNDRIIGGSVFEFVNANWHDIATDIKQLLPELFEDALTIYKNIITRCIDMSASVVCLKNGIVCEFKEADKLYVPTGYFKTETQELYLRCSPRKGVKGYGWYYDCITYENAPLSVYDKKNWLELWADLGDSDFLTSLANKTLEERWSFENRADYGILRNYLVYTFAHQWASDNIAYSSDHQYAAFNTGLPDRNTYKYLYAFFEKAPESAAPSYHPLHHVQRYRFRDFVIQGRGGDGKILSTSIRPLPNPPQYFKARSSTVWELDFNESNQITMPEYDDVHILIQRCDRIPLDFYRFPAEKSERLKKILNSNADAEEIYRNIREYFRPIIEDRPDAEVTAVYRTLTDALYNVISIAVKKLSWNWRAVVPCFNPEKNEACYLLPVSFCDSMKPDRAMIASSHKSEDETFYVIHTIIPLEWAYLDARLVCRPESEWLAVDCIC